jgi:hypothetical protein
MMTGIGAPPIAVQAAVVPGRRSDPQTQSGETQDALQVGEQHLEFFAIVTRLHAGGRGVAPAFIGGGACPQKPR